MPEFAIDRATKVEIEKKIADMRSKAEAVEETTIKYNEADDDEANDEAKTLYNVLHSRVKEYNDSRLAFLQTIATLVETMQGKFDEKSERFAESEKGQAVSEWIESLENLDVEEIVLPDEREPGVQIDFDLPDFDELGIEDKPGEY